MANKWITFVKAYAKDKGISYSDALKDPNTKARYKKGGAVNPRWWEDPSIPPTNPLDIKGMMEYNKRNPSYAKAWEENWKTMPKATNYEDMMG
jgi:hypothetical protein